MDDGATLQRLVDEAAVRDLAVRYASALDALDRDALAAVFTPDATASLGGGRQEGFDAIWRRVHRVLAPLALSQHLLGNHEVHVDGDRATHRCSVHAQHVRPGLSGGEQHVVAGRYDDECVRTAEGWRIAHRTLTVLWTAGNPEVTAGGEPIR